MYGCFVAIGMNVGLPAAIVMATEIPASAVMATRVPDDVAMTAGVHAAIILPTVVEVIVGQLAVVVTASALL